MTKKAASGISYVLWLLLFLIAFLCYTTGLDSLYLPSNGDEMVYSRIARLTAESGHWLPLVSDLHAMRNTKPPLLFWQAIAAGDWGQQWDLWRLRLPAVVYSGLIAVGTGLMAARITNTSPAAANGTSTQRGAVVTALTSACVYLAFFSSFRYGRPYLTSAAETFWLCLPPALVLWRFARDPHAPLPAWRSFALFGLLWGVGLLYKSFALVLPAAAGLGCMVLALYGRAAPSTGLRMAWQTAVRIALSTAVALAVFALWFVFDPDPGAVWREFVVGENVGKLAPTSATLSSKAVAVMVQALAWVENAGPLAGVVLGLMVLGVRCTLPTLHVFLQRGAAGRHAPLAPGSRMQLALAAWALVWLLVFCLPSQRSARYVIPAMPAIAVLVALNWQRLGRGWFAASILLCLPVLLLLGRIAQAEWGLGIASDGEWAVAALWLALGLALVACGVARARWTRACTVALGLVLYGLLNAALAPLSGPAGHFGPAAATLPAGARIAVPSGFNAQHERYRFLLPPAGHLNTAPYPATRDGVQLQALLSTHDAVIWQGRAQDDAPDCVSASTSPCRILAQRWDIRSRHHSGEIRADNLWQVEQWAFGREWLLVRATGP